MKDSEIYLRAVDQLERCHLWSSVGMCYAIRTSKKFGKYATNPEEAISLLEQYMKPKYREIRGQVSDWWGEHWSENVYERRDCRVLALLFMAEIAKDAERARSRKPQKRSRK